MHLNSALLFDRYAKGYFTAGSRVLELGPDGRPSTFEQLLSDPTLRWETANLESAGGGVTYPMAEECLVPVADDSFDVVLSGQVIEHVRRPWAWMVELARVTRPGGVVVTICPVSWPYHEEPIDCWRIYPEGMRALCTDAGLSVELVVCDSLEPPKRGSYPGESYGYRHRSSRLSWSTEVLKRFVGWPTPAAVDTVAVARKPSP